MLLWKVGNFVEFMDTDILEYGKHTSSEVNMLYLLADELSGY